MEYSFYGLRRSGNHAILEWLTINLGQSTKREVVKKNRIISYNNACYMNEVNTYNEIDIKRDIKFCKENYNNLITSFEDVTPDFDIEETIKFKKIAIIRDIENLFASRYKRWLDTGIKGMEIDEEIIKKWKIISDCEKNGVLLIKFENWVTSKDYRNNICEKLKIKNLDIIDTITNFGNGSSFSGRKLPSVEELINRKKQIQLPKETTNRLKSKDITEIRRKLGYI